MDKEEPPTNPASVYCTVPLGAAEKDSLRQSLEATPIVFADELDDGQEPNAFLRATVCFGNVPPAWLEQTERLQWIQLDSVGFGRYQRIRPKQAFQMTHLKHFFDTPVAESALAGILALGREVDTLIQLQDRRKWVGDDLRPRMRLLTDARVCVLGGTGGIGQRLIELLTPFRVEVIAFGRQSAQADITTLDELDEALPKMDIVVGALPETKETIGLMDARRLGLLAAHALFVNMGRGSLVDEAALIDLLQHQRIGGAVLDVTQEEPLPPNHPLWSCPRTLLTQHTGGGFQEELKAKVRVFLANWRRFTEGQPLPHQVDLDRGY